MADKTETTNKTPDHSAGVNILVHDTVWQINDYQLFSHESQVENCYLHIDEQRRVSCGGHQQWPSTHFKVFNQTARESPKSPVEYLMMFECIGGKWAGYMLCVDKEGLLSCQEKTKDYINIQDAEKEVLFVRERRYGENDGYFALRSYLSDRVRYVGFDKRGEAKDLTKVDPDRPEGQFQMK